MQITMSEAIGEELRAAIARVRLSGAALGRHLGKPQPWISRRLTGSVPFDVDQLDAVCELLGIDLVADDECGRDAKEPPPAAADRGFAWCGAPGGIRTPNLLIRSQMPYPLGHGRFVLLFSSDLRGSGGI